jgi:hypothetical protein
MIMAFAATKERAHELIDRMEPEKVSVIVEALEKMANTKLPVRSGRRILGAGKAFTHLPSPEALERIAHEWKREVLEKRFGSVAE